MKPREFWIDLDDFTEAEVSDETSEVVSTDAFVARKECPHEDAVHVIEKSAYDELKAALESANIHRGVERHRIVKLSEALRFYVKMAPTINAYIASEALSKYGEEPS